MLLSKKRSLFRFNHQPPDFLPLAVRSVGEYELAAGSEMEPPLTKWFCEIFWSEWGSGEFRLGRKTIRVSDAQIFYLLPGELHDIHPVSERWKYHWFTLDHPESALWIAAMGLRERPLPARRCPVELFNELYTKVSLGTVAADREAAHIAHAILLAAMEGSLPAFAERRPTWVEQCRQAIDENYGDPDLNVTAISREMKIHRATLFRAFVAAFGMTPSSYLQSRRVHHAMELLKNSDISIKEVSNQVGLNDANYLARLLVRTSGMSPRQFRAAHRAPAGG